MKHIVSPSILSADFSNLETDIRMLDQSEAEWIHIDVMDGVFVPNISFGFPVIKAIRPHTNKFFDVHAMIVQPDLYIQDFKQAGADLLTVHYEACPHLHRTIQAIKASGMQAGVALNPHTPVSAVAEVIEMLDLLLIMSVNPGFGGQSFIEHTYKKVSEAAALIQKANAPTRIEVDGGVTLQQANRLYAAGASVLVAGSFVFNAPDKHAIIAQLKNA